MNNDDFCEWERCTKRASHVLREVEVRKDGEASTVDVGDIYLCLDHYRYASSTGRMSLSWERVYRALA